MLSFFLRPFLSILGERYKSYYLQPFINHLMRVKNLYICNLLLASSIEDVIDLSINNLLSSHLRKLLQIFPFATFLDFTFTVFYEVKSSAPVLMQYRCQGNTLRAIQITTTSGLYIVHIPYKINCTYVIYILVVI